MTDDLWDGGDPWDEGDADDRFYSGYCVHGAGFDEPCDECGDDAYCDSWRGSPSTEEREPK